MTTNKDLPLHRGNPVNVDKQQMAEAFHRAIDVPQDKQHGLPAKRAAENQRKALALLKSVRAKR